MSSKISFTIHELVSALDVSADALLVSKYGITASQFVFLAVCHDVEPTDVTRLAECIGISKAAVSKRVPAMVKDGWITTAADPGHGRRVIISLTDRARDLVETAGHELDARFAAIFTDPRAQDIDLATLNRQLNILTTILTEKGTLS